MQKAKEYCNKAATFTRLPQVNYAFIDESARARPEQREGRSATFPSRIFSRETWRGQEGARRARRVTAGHRNREAQGHAAASPR